RPQPPACYPLRPKIRPPRCPSLRSAIAAASASTLSPESAPAPARRSSPVQPSCPPSRMPAPLYSETVTPAKAAEFLHESAKGRKHEEVRRPVGLYPPSVPFLSRFRPFALSCEKTDNSIALPSVRTLAGSGSDPRCPGAEGSTPDPPAACSNTGFPPC